MHMFKRVFMILAYCQILPQPILADVKLPALFGDNMLLQANKPVPVWGSADVGEKVTVSFAGQKVSSTADANGHWQLKLDPLASSTAGIMLVEGKNQIRINNVLVGTVWICSGQSNMELRIGAVNNAAAEISKADYPKIRLFRVKKATALQPQLDVEGHWVECSPETLPNQEDGFSAVAYFFGRDVHQATRLPVGLIEAAWGGTPAEAWTSLSGLQQKMELKEHVQRFENLVQTMPELKAEYQKKRAELPKEHTAWEEANKPYREALKAWAAAAALAQAENRPVPKKPQPASPKPWLSAEPDKDPQNPTYLYNGMIAPLIPYAIEGAIWYQGEKNAPRAQEYRTLFPAMITDWRAKWGQGDFPFYYCQLANFMAKQTRSMESAWAELREAQRLTLRLPNTGMAVLIDIGESGDIHPLNKQEVGERLAKIALAKLFGKEMRYTGPVYRSMKVEGEKIRLHFDPSGGELFARELPPNYPVSLVKGQFQPLVRNRPGSQLEGFAICGADRKWVWADAVIEGHTVVVSAPEVQQPVAVRYAWTNNPTCNLYNKEGLPASPFQTDEDSLVLNINE